jgi:hypothetical protein
MQLVVLLAALVVNLTGDAIYIFDMLAYIAAAYSRPTWAFSCC